MSTNRTFIMIPLALNGRGLSLLAKLTYGALLLHSVEERGEIVSRVSYAQLKEILERDQQAIARAIRELDAAKLVARFDREGGLGGGFRLAMGRRGEEAPPIESEAPPPVKSEGGPPIKSEAPPPIKNEGGPPIKSDHPPLSKVITPPLSKVTTPPAAPYRNAREEENSENSEDYDNSRGGEVVAEEGIFSTPETFEQLTRWVAESAPNPLDWEGSGLLNLTSGYPIPWAFQAIQAAIAAEAARPKLWALKALQSWKRFAEEDRRAGRPVSQQPWEDYRTDKHGRLLRDGTPSPPRLEESDEEDRKVEEKLRKQEAAYASRAVGR